MYIVLSISVLLLISLLIYCYIYDKKRFKEIISNKDIEEKDFENIEKKFILQDGALNLINSNIKQELNMLDKTKDLSAIVNRLKEESNNIEVVVNDVFPNNIEERNLIEDLNKLVDSIKNKNRKKEISLEFIDIDNNYIYDHFKLISAIRLIIKNSFDNNTNDIKIKVKNNENYFLTSNISIVIENVNLLNGKDNSDLKDIIDLLNINSISPNINEVNINPIFLIIRQNLLQISKSLIIEEHKIIINLELKKTKINNKIKKALIVDDYKATAKLNKEVLNELNITSKCVYSGTECLEELKNNYNDYDLIITDNQMPKMNGTELIKELRNIEDFSLPVVIVTGDSNENNIFTEYYGFDGYIQKPLTKEQIESIINQIFK